MKRNPSKSSHVKNKTILTVQDSNMRKNSRMAKASSCTKIQSSQIEQHPNGQYQKYLKKIQQNHIQKANTLNIKESRGKVKSSLETVKQKKDSLHINGSKSNEISHLIAKNSELIAENNQLKNRCCDLQENSLKDKEKIKNLLVRISEVRHSNGITSNHGEMRSMHPSKGQLFAVSNTKSKDIMTPYKIIDGENQVCSIKECVERKKYLESQLYKERIRRDQLQMQKKEWQKNRDHLRNQYKELLEQIQQIKEGQL